MAKIRLLYIEDTKFDQIAFSRFMGKLSDQYEIMMASSVQEAKDILEKNDFNLIICDYALGDGTAFDILEFQKSIPIIIATGFGSEEIAVNAIKMGAKDYLIKDIDCNYLKMLPVMIDNILKQSQQEKDIVKARKQAEESTILKEAFLANMSHEIRTPMNAIIGFADILSKSNLNAEDNEYVNIIKSAGENLLTIINDILDMSKINAGMMAFEEISFSVRESLKSLNFMLLEKAKEKEIDLKFNCDEDVPDVLLGDPTRLAQIILNLAGNAIKFTKTGSVHVNVKVLQQTEENVVLEFSIVDTGIGIPEAELKHIFDRFRQAESHTTRKYGGTGLGLSIAKQLVELQKGTMAVKSEFKVGSTFSFSIPYKKSVLELPSQVVIEKKYDIDKLKKLNILLVEDNHMNIQLVLHLFSKHNLQLEVAGNGRECIEKINQKKFDIILMDMEMPVMNGYEATTIIRNDLKNNIPIIAMTAHTMAGERERCLNLGMNDYISKPINANQLFEKIYELTNLVEH